MLRTAGFAGDRQERPLEALPADPAGQPGGQATAIGHLWQGVVEGLAAGSALEAPGVDVETHAAGVPRQVFDMPFSPPEPDQLAGLAVDAGRYGLHDLGMDMVVVLVFLDPRYAIGGRFRMSAGMLTRAAYGEASRRSHSYGAMPSPESPSARSSSSSPLILSNRVHAKCAQTDLMMSQSCHLGSRFLYSDSPGITSSRS